MIAVESEVKKDSEKKKSTLLPSERVVVTVKPSSSCVAAVKFLAYCPAVKLANVSERGGRGGGKFNRDTVG